MTTASQAYEANANEIAELIESIQAKLKTHAAHQKNEPRNWGYAGDLGHIAQLLREANDALGTAEQSADARATFGYRV